MPKTDRIRQTGIFANSNEAQASLEAAGDLAVVIRGVPRMLMLKCPCDCGDILVINLDRRVGPAWRMYSSGNSLTLYPSYWRDSKCESHFVLWNSRVYWCGWADDDRLWGGQSDIEDRVLEALTADFVNYEQLAEELQEIPWDVLRACYALERKKLAVVNSDRRTGQFRRAAQP